MSETVATPIPEVIEHLLLGRGFKADELETFLQPSYEAGLADPFLLTDMKLAVGRILQAAEKRETVVIYGDYDIDGITASAVMIEALAALGITASSYIPDRFEEGYGLNQAALESLQQKGAQLVISVDCGITSVDEAKWAREHKLDLIITDHHAMPETLPEAVAVINPKRPKDKYPFKELAGVGVAFALVRALQATTGKPEAGQEKWLLDLVALGTVCDVMELTGENRVLVSFGLKVLRRSRRPGIAALATVAGIDPTLLKASQLGYALGPRLNAAGRLEHADQALELLMTMDNGRATELASKLQSLNEQRQGDQATILAAAKAMAEEYKDDPVLVLAHPDWSHGIVGIVAGRLAESLHKPTLVLQILGAEAKGSARTAGNFNIVDGLRAASSHLQKFGGHAAAAGATLAVDQIDPLRQTLNEYYRAGDFSTEANVERTAELTLPLPALDLSLLEALELLEPCGIGNPTPLVAINDMTINQIYPVGQQGQHLKLRFTDGQCTLNGIGFGLAERYPDLTAGSRINAIGRAQENRFNGRVSAEIQVLEIRPVE